MVPSLCPAWTWPASSSISVTGASKLDRSTSSSNIDWYICMRERMRSELLFSAMFALSASGFKIPSTLDQPNIGFQDTLGHLGLKHVNCLSRCSTLLTYLCNQLPRTCKCKQEPLEGRTMELAEQGQKTLGHGEQGDPKDKCTSNIQRNNRKQNHNETHWSTRTALF